MKIFKISFNEVIPKDKMIGNWYVNSFYNPPDQGLITVIKILTKLTKI